MGWDGQQPQKPTENVIYKIRCCWLSVAKPSESQTARRAGRQALLNWLKVKNFYSIWQFGVLGGNCKLETDMKQKITKKKGNILGEETNSKFYQLKANLRFWKLSVE